MHPTLTSTGNLLLALLSGGLAAFLTFIFPEVLPVVVIGAVFGIIAGAFQARAFRENSERAAAATTALGVRKALSDTRAGRIAIGVQWFATIPMLVAAYMTPERVFLAFSAGYAAFMFARECTAFPAVRRLPLNDTSSAG